MLKFSFFVSPPTVWAGLIVVFLFLFSAVNGRTSSLREPAPQSDAQFQARDMLDRGVQAFKNGQYDEATRDFLRAKQLDPKLLNARLYLATTYASEYIPGAPSEDNIRMGKAAVEEFRGVLNIEPQNISAIDGLGSMLFQMGGSPFDPDLFQESKSCHQKHIYLRPDDPEPYYWIWCH
jgi:Tfp pilus assembly protein PilF